MKIRREVLPSRRVKRFLSGRKSEHPRVAGFVSILRTIIGADGAERVFLRCHDFWRRPSGKRLQPAHWQGAVFPHGRSAGTKNRHRHGISLEYG